MSGKELPISDYRLQRILFFEKSYKWIPSAEEDGTQGDREINFEWDWLYMAEDEFSVVLGCDLSPSREHPDSVSVTLVADFDFATGAGPVQFENFVCEEAPRLLFPHVAQAVESLTSQAVSGAYILPLFDIAEVIRREFRFTEASGTRDLQALPRVAPRFGVETRQHAKKTRSGASKTSTGSRRKERKGAAPK